MILFSPEVFAVQRVGGVTRCMVSLMRALGEEGVDWRLYAGEHCNLYLRDMADDSRLVDARYRERVGRLSVSIGGEAAFVRHARRTRPGVVHRSQYPLIDRLPRAQAVVSTLHDLWTERAGAGAVDRVRSRFKLAALRRSDRVVCISEATRQEMLATAPDLDARTVVIHHGVAPLSLEPVAPTNDRPYFLFVGARAGKKNCDVVLRALARSPALRGFGLVCVGGGAFSPEELAAFAALGLGDRVRQITASDAELAGLYEHAAALCYPSRHEGFGMPLLEAMIHDCPVIAAPVSCMPEIGGEAAVYADPDSPEAWGAAMERLAGDTAAADAFRALGRTRAAQFSWNKSARAHRALYEELAPGSTH